jgi:hypothetical protein
MMTGLPPSMTAAAEFEVPKSMPMILAMTTSFQLALLET